MAILGKLWGGGGGGARVDRLGSDALTSKSLPRNWRTGGRERVGIDGAAGLDWLVRLENLAGSSHALSARNYYDVGLVSR